MDAAIDVPIVGHFREWNGTPTHIPGSLVVTERELIVTDHPFDDRGGDVVLDPRVLTPDPLAIAAGKAAVDGAYGDYEYPPDGSPGAEKYPIGSADIVEVRVAADLDAWYILVSLNALTDRDSVGLDIVLEDESRLRVRGSAADIEGSPVEVATDLDSNRVELRIPNSSYDPGSRRMTVFVAAGLWDPVAEDWVRHGGTTGGAAYFDLAYVPGEKYTSYWLEESQARHIATGAFSDDRFAVDFGRLRSPTDCASAPCLDTSPYAGFYTRSFRSGQSLGEGVSAQRRWGQSELVDGYKLYRSPVQPYAVYVPIVDPAEDHPLALLLHPAGGNHMSYPLTAMEGIRSWADETGTLVVMPFARGEGGWYEAEAEVDVFEMWTDVATNLPVDHERIYVMGVGMGGFGALRLISLYPDLFAKALAWGAPLTPNGSWLAPLPVTFPQQSPPACAEGSEGCGYNLLPLLVNARNVPVLFVYGGRDPEVPVTGAESWMADFDADAGEYRYMLFPGRGHETSWPADGFLDVLSWLEDRRPRARNPARVTYRLSRAASGFGSLMRVTGGAYWIRDAVLADGSHAGAVDAWQGSKPQPGPAEPAVWGNSDAGYFRRTGRGPAVAQTLGNHAHLELTDIAEVSLATEWMLWDPESDGLIEVTTDHPVELRILGSFPEDVQVLGAPFQRDVDALLVSLPPGISTLTILP